MFVHIGLQSVSVLVLLFLCLISDSELAWAVTHKPSMSFNALLVVFPQCFIWRVYDGQYSLVIVSNTPVEMHTSEVPSEILSSPSIYKKVFSSKIISKWRWSTPQKACKFTRVPCTSITIFTMYYHISYFFYVIEYHCLKFLTLRW